ncbi:MAG TPA: tetratricopeptide repeat protein, partial [Acidobacteriota bacterium]|nr:tetratricopeptide repeat protein [Acidobacteriota bacterium]
SRGLAELAAGNWEESEANLDQALKLDPSNAKALYAMGLLRQAQKRIEDAQGFFERALAEDPDYWDALTELGAIHYTAGRYKEAQEAFLRTIELRPDSHIGYRNLGGILMLLGDLSGAAANFQKSLEIRPEAAAYSNLGTLQFFRGLYAESAAAYEKAIELGAGDYLIWANLGDAYRQLPQSAEKAEDAFQIAIQKMRELLEETPEDPTLIVQLAVALAKSGRSQEALQVAESVPDSAVGGDVQLRYLLLLTDELAGEREKALASLGGLLQAGYPLQMLKNDPELAEIRKDPRYHRIVTRAAAQDQR